MLAHNVVLIASYAVLVVFSVIMAGFCFYKAVNGSTTRRAVFVFANNTVYFLILWTAYLYFVDVYDR